MKKILVMLMLIVSIGVKAQVYALEYTKYVLHDIVKKKQYKEVPVKASVYFDIPHENIYIISDSSRILDVIVLNTQQKSENVIWYNCVDYKTNLIWDIYITTQGSNCSKKDVLQAKSKESEFWLTKPVICNK